MSFGIDNRRLQHLVSLYSPMNYGEQIYFMMQMGGEEQLFINLQTSPFQGISQDSVQQRRHWFGVNNEGKQIDSAIKRVINVVWKCLPIKIILLIGIGCVILSYVTRYSSLPMQSLEGYFCIGLAILTLMILIIPSIIYAPQPPNLLPYCNTNITRQNKQIQASVQDLVVGDVLDISQGMVVPVDGWIIEGTVDVDQKYGAEWKKQTKDTMRNCIQDMTRRFQIDNNSDTSKALLSLKSPILLSGTRILSGQCKMIILCVGNHSKVGAFRSLIEHSSTPSLIQSKIESMINEVLKLAITAVIVFELAFIGRFVVTGLLTSKLAWPDIDDAALIIWKGVLAIIIALPQGIVIGLAVGFLRVQIALKSQEGIIIKRGSDCPSMAFVSYITYDKENEANSHKYKEWWNETTEQLGQSNPDSIIDIKEDGIHQQFLNLFYLGVQVNLGIQPCQMLQQQSMKKAHVTNIQGLSIISMPILKENFNAQNKNNDKQSIMPNKSYICCQNMVKFCIFQTPSTSSEQEYLFIKGQSLELLDLCSFILMKSTGEHHVLTQPMKYDIRDVIKSMDRRLVKSHVVAYKCKTFQNDRQDMVTQVQTGGFVLLYIIGMSPIRDSAEYEIVRKLKRIGVDMVVASKDCLPQSVNRSRQTGISVPSEDSLVLRGKDFLKVIGGVMCSVCRKGFCSCQSPSAQTARVRNLDEFRRIMRHLRVLAQSHYPHKYALVVGLKNISKCCAVIGKCTDDLPAMRNAQVGLAVDYESIIGQEQSLQFSSQSAELASHTADILLPVNSLRGIYKLIGWSRFSLNFIKKYLQLLLTNSLVGTIIHLALLLLSKTYLISLIQHLYLSAVVSPLLALGLALDRPQEQMMNDKQQTYQKDKEIMDIGVIKQVCIQGFAQTMLILFITFTGHLYIPQQHDAVDTIIGSDWAAKYSNIDKTHICTGLANDIYSNAPLYDINHYGIFSRHGTIIFNLFSIMHIFNYFNCRKLKEHQINIFEGIGVGGIAVVMGALLIQWMAISLGGSTLGMYPYGLTLSQWAICIGLSMIVWVVGFVIKLMPAASVNQHKFILKHSNKSYNLAVKSVHTCSQLSQFYIQDDVLPKRKEK